MPEYLLSSGLPSYPAGLNDKDAVLVLPVYRAINNLANKVSAVTGQQQFAPSELSLLRPFDVLSNARNNLVFAVATEALSFGMAVNIYDNAGVVSARKADRSLTRPAHGLVNSINGAAIGATCEIMFMQGRSQGVTGSVVGSAYYLNTAGTVTATKPTTGMIQPVGWGLGTHGFYLNIEAP